jgi:hypothetical protein
MRDSLCSFLLYLFPLFMRQRLFRLLNYPKTLGKSKFFQVILDLVFVLRFFFLFQFFSFFFIFLQKECFIFTFRNHFRIMRIASDHCPLLSQRDWIFQLLNSRNNCCFILIFDYFWQLLNWFC